MRSGFVTVVLTIDRSPSPNYLRETLANFVRSAGGPHGVDLILQVGDDQRMWAEDQVAAERLQGRVEVLCATERLCANLNVSAALENAARKATAIGRGMILFTEDDLDVCADFFDSVGAWLDDHARDDRRIYAFGTPYPSIAQAARAGATSWDYPLRSFYGTQAIALRSQDAADLSAYLVEHCYDRTEDGTAYDLLMKDWHGARYPAIDHLISAVPSFVQHIGRESIIRPRAKTHEFSSWPGRDWSYIQRRAA